MNPYNAGTKHARFSPPKLGFTKVILATVHHPWVAITPTRFGHRVSGITGNQMSHFRQGSQYSNYRTGYWSSCKRGNSPSQRTVTSWHTRNPICFCTPLGVWSRDIIQQKFLRVKRIPWFRINRLHDLLRLPKKKKKKGNYTQNRRSTIWLVFVASPKPSNLQMSDVVFGHEDY